MSLSACGVVQTAQDVGEPHGKFPVQVVMARFPTSQRLSEHTHLVLKIRNVGHKPIPDLAVSILNPNSGTAAQAFGADVTAHGLANPSRPTWTIDKPPGPCSGDRGFSCQNGGPGGWVTSDTNTWAIGHSLAPGHTITFDWGVTAVTAGTYKVEYLIAAGLNGNAKAVLPGGGLPQGLFTVRISNAPQQSYVNNQGQIVPSPPAAGGIVPSNGNQ